MRIAIISDIHANLEALQKAFAVIDERHADEIVALGDTVGYGGSPNECIELLRSRTEYVLLGNHDKAAIDIAEAESFNTVARTAAAWTSQILTEANKDFLRTLPFQIVRHGITFVHSSPFEPEEWHYVLSPAAAAKNFASFATRLCFIGHSHDPEIYCEDVWTKDVLPGKRYLINVGSIGQPRDGDPRLSFGLYDTETEEYENIRAAYDVKTASEKIRKAGLPTVLAERILAGK